MLKTRIITALVLLAVVIPVLFSSSYPAIAVLALAFFAAAAWECARLFGSERPLWFAIPAALAFAALLWVRPFAQLELLYALCVGIWALRLSPNLALGLPPLNSLGNRLQALIYGVAIFGAFAALVSLLTHSPLYLLSVMVLVWIADIGAYFAGRRFGKRKLAITISPGKSWEGAIGGWLAVLAFGVACGLLAPGTKLADMFVPQIQQRYGWFVTILLLSLMCAASVVGDLIESQLKRRIGMKDSSQLLPGHGGVLDRIDALLPVLPLAALIDLMLLSGHQ